MNDTNFDSGNPLENLGALEGKVIDLVDDGHYGSAMRVAQELRRAAKAEQQFQPYVTALFVIMNHARDVLQTEAGCEAAVELIGLLESEDRARAFQPDLSAADYESHAHVYTACAYDNLAANTGEQFGYNCEGMHACIADGMQVCRRTGKLECITCFREYATEVYRAADDLDLAIHFARAGIAHDNPGPHDRRWVGARDLALLLLYRGELQAAYEAAEQAWQMVGHYHSPEDATRKTRLLLRQMAQLLGRPELADEIAKREGPEDSEDSPAGENPSHECWAARIDAIAAANASNFDDAIAILSEWDSRLTREKSLDQWFNVRLQLIATQRLAGNQAQAERLGQHLESKARPACDYLTLRRLARLRDANATIDPCGLAGPVDAGPYATAAAAAARSAEEPAKGAAEVPEDAAADAAGDASEAAATSNEPPEIVRGFCERLDSIYNREEPLSDEQQVAECAAVRSDMLAIDPAGVENVEDARWLLSIVRSALGDGADNAAVWHWGEALTRSHSQDATILNLLANLGAHIRFGANEEAAALVTEERIEALFRESLDLDPENPRNFDRAGFYFLHTENLGEAERCYARGFRLARSDVEMARRLAMVYRRTDRARDALAVLDICLRTGVQDPDLAWDAATSAFDQNQFEPCLTYLDVFESWVPEAPWTNYFRAAALLELELYGEALAAAEVGQRLNSEAPITGLIHRTAALAGLGQLDELRAPLAEVFKHELTSVDYLTSTGLCSLMRLLWIGVAKALPSGDAQLTDLEDLLLQTSLAPDELFEKHRQESSEEPIQGVGFYICELEQSLDEEWPTFRGCLAHEVEWNHYRVRWGVLARDEEEAQRIVLDWQRRAHPGEPRVIDCSEQSSGYRDKVGVVWQGVRGTVEEETPA